MKYLYEKIIGLLYSKGVIKSMHECRFTPHERDLINMCLTIYQMGRDSVNPEVVETSMSLSDQRLIDKIRLLEIEAMQPNASPKLLWDLMYYTKQLCNDQRG